MLVSYHLFFIGLSFVLLILGMIFLFLLTKQYEWSMLVGFILLGLNMVFCWICVLGFFGVEMIGLTSTDTFTVYTYPDMYGLNVLPFGLLLITVMVAWVGWGRHLRKVANELNRPTINSPVRKSGYWD